MLIIVDNYLTACKVKNKITKSKLLSCFSSIFVYQIVQLAETTYPLAEITAVLIKLRYTHCVKVIVEAKQRVNEQKY